jgi:hypothetical protein
MRELALPHRGDRGCSRGCERYFLVLRLAFLAVDLRAPAFFAVDFLAVDLRAPAFLAVDFFAADFLAVLFLAVDFFAVDFLAVLFLAVDFFAVDFLAVLFLAVDFLAVDLRAADFFAVDFFAVDLRPLDAFLAAGAAFFAAGLIGEQGLSVGVCLVMAAAAAASAEADLGETATDQPLSAVLNALPGANRTPFDALMSTGSPVCGLRPVRAALDVGTKLPKPRMLTLSPDFVASITASTSALSAASA